MPATPMKKIKPSINLQNKNRYRLWLKALFIILTFYGMAQGKSEFSELISLNTSNEPLAEVLANVSQASGCELIIDENWVDLPITVKFEAIPLDQALKRILAKVNHAIIYQSDRKVLIKIYDKDSGIPGHTGASGINRLPPAPAYQPPSIETPTSPNPVPPEPINEEAESEGLESEEPEPSSQEPETPEEETKDEDHAESSGEAAQDRN